MFSKAVKQENSFDGVKFCPKVVKPYRKILKFAADEEQKNRQEVLPSIEISRTSVSIKCLESPKDAIIHPNHGQMNNVFAYVDEELILKCFLFINWSLTVCV